MPAAGTRGAAPLSDAPGISARGPGSDAQVKESDTLVDDTYVSEKFILQYAPSNEVVEAMSKVGARPPLPCLSAAAADRGQRARDLARRWGAPQDHKVVLKLRLNMQEKPQW